jgi:heat shock protein beta
LTHFVGVQPDNSAQLGGKIYEMMGMALSGKWSSPNQFESIQNQLHVLETVEAVLFELTESGNQK